MSDSATIEIVTCNAGQTHRLGRLIGEHLTDGLVIRLTGDLGSGKTCFVQGLAQGLDVPEDYGITSPTYAIMHEYPGRLRLVHVDLYRLADEMDAESIGLEDYLGPGTVMAVEWADRFAEAFWPPESLKLDFCTCADETRRVRLFGYGLQNINLINEVFAQWDGGQGEPSAR